MKWVWHCDIENIWKFPWMVGICCWKHKSHTNGHKPQGTLQSFFNKQCPTLSKLCSSHHPVKNSLADSLHTLYQSFWFLRKRHKIQIHYTITQHPVKIHHLWQWSHSFSGFFLPGSFILWPGAQCVCISAILHPVLLAKLLQKYPIKTPQTVSIVAAHFCRAKRPWAK